MLGSYFVKDWSYFSGKIKTGWFLRYIRNENFQIFLYQRRYKPKDDEYRWLLKKKEEACLLLT